MTKLDEYKKWEWKVWCVQDLTNKFYPCAIVESSDPVDAVKQALKDMNRANIERVQVYELVPNSLFKIDTNLKVIKE